jgi:hypothetical protein
MGDFDRGEISGAGVADGASKPEFKAGQSASGSKAPLYMQSSDGKHVFVRRLKRKEDGSWKIFTRWFVENQIGTSAQASIGALENLQLEIQPHNSLFAQLRLQWLSRSELGTL